MTARKTSELITPLELQPEHKPRETGCYELDELCRYHDRTFVNCSYAALAKRPPGPEELAGNLNDLRSGRRDKIDIIEELLDTKEAREARVRVKGLRPRSLRRAARWPVVGYLWRLARGVARLPVHVQHQRKFEAHALGQQQQITDHVNDVIAPALADSIDAVLMLSESLQGHVLSLEESLASLAARQEQLKVRISDHQHQLEAKIDAQQDRLEATINAQQSQLEATNNTHRQELDAGMNAQQELIVREQAVIVETQKVVIDQMRAEFSALAKVHERQIAELLDQLRRLETINKPARTKA